eukprot:TRINITY_DN1648_c0_g2_i12.p1 TRINITY_DN1648_c0_g2~~TRINITY_DN1648_c0_g2_i12.p1  ORF type:complete len:304 (+),score=61.14 TRINITY_DN1648_c0_g2_i12:119-1030(+)
MCIRDSSYFSPQKLTPLFETEYNETSFFKEIRYEYIPHDLSSIQSPSLHCQSIETRPEPLEVCSNSVTIADMTQSYTSSSLSPEFAREESKGAVRKSVHRKRSFTTADESIRSFRAETKTVFTMGLANPSQPLLNSIKISIGSFNSISTELACPSKATAFPSPKEAPKASSKKKSCSCRRSHCLKLYCECFANGGFCDGCGCIGCHNQEDNQAKILEARRVLAEKNPNGAKRHFPEKPQRTTCNCAKSECIKRYCECFKAGGRCGTGCNCTGCRNNTALRTISCSEYEKIIKKRKLETTCNRT